MCNILLLHVQGLLRKKNIKNIESKIPDEEDFQLEVMVYSAVLEPTVACKSRYSGSVSMFLLLIILEHPTSHNTFVLND